MYSDFQLMAKLMSDHGFFSSYVSCAQARKEFFEVYGRELNMSQIEELFHRYKALKNLIASKAARFSPLERKTDLEILAHIAEECEAANRVLTVGDVLSEFSKHGGELGFLKLLAMAYKYRGEEKNEIQASARAAAPSIPRRRSARLAAKNQTNM